MLQPQLKKVYPLKEQRLKLVFETGETRLFDVSPYIQGEWYEQLQNVQYFNQVRILPDGSGIEWPDGQDISPHELYDLSIAAEDILL